MEPRIGVLLDTAVTFIPKDSVIYRMIADIREWRSTTPDWREAFGLLAEHYGYHKYGGNCHIVPNHGLIVLSLLWGDDDFQKTLMIVNTCGWDTDCNSGNVGCLMGIKNGLAGLDAGPDYRGPVADRLYLPTADGGRAITDAVTEAYHIINCGRALAGEAPLAPKAGARFHFDLPGAVQAWLPEDSLESKGTLTLENVAGHSLRGARSLALRYHGVATGRPARAATATFTPPAAANMPGYGLLASPTLYPGQTVRARLCADSDNVTPVTCGLYLRFYGDGDRLERVSGPCVTLTPGAAHEFTWRIPPMDGNPIAEIGVAINSARRADGVIYLDYLTWDGAPDVTLARPNHTGTMWQRAWVNGVDQSLHWGETYRLIQNEGVGLLIQGTREWKDYRVTADVIPHLVKSAGIAARVQGMRRYYALLVSFAGEPPLSKLRLVKVLHDATTLAEMDFPWAFGETHTLSLEVVGATLRAWVDAVPVFTTTDAEQSLADGAVALVCEEGRMATNVVTIQPA